MKNVNLSEMYEVKLGKYSDKYMVVEVDMGTQKTTLRRIRTAVSKIDSVRLPERVSISFVGKKIH